MRYGTEKRDNMTVNYADVLRQAVENERSRVLREVYAFLDREPIDELVGGYSYRTRDIPARKFQDSVKRNIKTLEDN